MNRTTAAWARLGAAGVAIAAMVPLSTTAAVAADTVYTMADVQQHAATSDCWSAVNGSVYDLTALIRAHPGGSRVIVATCGQDGTRSFDGQHGGSARLAASLAGYKVGVLDTASAPSAPATLSTPPTTATPIVAAGSVTMRQVRQHHRPADCWSAISGNAYNLTEWVKGQQGIHAGDHMCGRDGTRQFLRTQAGQTDPTAAIASFKLGPIAARTTAGHHSDDDSGHDDSGHDDSGHGDGHHDSHSSDSGHGDDDD